MPKKPTSPFARRSQIIEWLKGAGMSGYEINKLFSTGTIKPVHFRTSARAYYAVAQVDEAVFPPVAAPNPSRIQP